MYTDDHLSANEFEFNYTKKHKAEQ